MQSVKKQQSVEAMSARLQELRNRQGLMVRTNQRIRRGAPVDVEPRRVVGAQGRQACGFDEGAIRRNWNEIRRLESALKAQQRREDAQPVTERGSGYVYREDPEANRVSFIFDVRPCAAVRALLADHGFKARGPLQLDWGRVMNTPGLAAGQCVRKNLDRAQEH